MYWYIDAFAKVQPIQQFLDAHAFWQTCHCKPCARNPTIIQNGDSFLICGNAQEEQVTKRVREKSLQNCCWKTVSHGIIWNTCNFLVQQIWYEQTWQHKQRRGYESDSLTLEFSKHRMFIQYIIWQRSKQGPTLFAGIASALETLQLITNVCSLRITLYFPQWLMQQMANPVQTIWGPSCSNKYFNTAPTHFTHFFFF